MGSPSVSEIATAVASLVSAIGGCAAAYAAFLSARSATDAIRASESAVKQAAIRELSRTAATIVLEATSLKALSLSAQGSIKASMAFAGVSSSSGHEELIHRARDAARAAEPILNDAQLFTDGAKRLSGAPIDEVERVSHRLWENLEGLRALRRQIEDIQSSIERQNEEHRSHLIARMHKP